MNFVNLLAKRTDQGLTSVVNTGSAVLDSVSSFADNINDSIKESREVSDQTRDERISNALFEAKLEIAQEKIALNDRATKLFKTDTKGKSISEVYSENMKKINEILNVN